MLKKSLGFLWLLSTFFVFESFGADGGWGRDPRGEEERLVRAAPAVLALPAPPEDGREIWELDQIIAELEKVFITERPIANTRFFNKTIRDISAHVVLPEARFKSLFTELSKSLEGDFYTHLYGAHPSLNLDDVAQFILIQSYSMLVGYALTQTIKPEESGFVLGVGALVMVGTVWISYGIKYTKYFFDHVRNEMQWDYRGWCCGSKGCCAPDEDDIGEASDLSKFVSILTIALNAEALEAMSDEVALNKLKRKIRTSLGACKEFTNERSEVLEYFFRNCDYRTCLTDGDLARDD